MRTLLYRDVYTSRKRDGSTLTPGFCPWPCSLYSSDAAIIGVGVICRSTKPNMRHVGSPGQMSEYTLVPMRAMCGDFARSSPPPPVHTST